MSGRKNGLNQEDWGNWERKSKLSYCGEEQKVSSLPRVIRKEMGQTALLGEIWEEMEQTALSKE